ncbi:MAG: hypothetical protein J0665_10560 [Deltaproteobacteria bacterium]|nr:hypothetical protein [Deltaproteobacteria bacterium]
MERLAVIFGTSTDGTLWGKHFGDAEIFVKYYLYPDKEPEYVGEVTNKARNVDEQHNSAGKLSEIIQLLGSCDCVAAVVMSPNFKKMAAEKPIQPVVVKVEKREELLHSLRKNFSMLEPLVMKRKGGVMEKEVPVISL